MWISADGRLNVPLATDVTVPVTPGATGLTTALRLALPCSTTAPSVGCQPARTLLTLLPVLSENSWIGTPPEANAVWPPPPLTGHVMVFCVADAKPFDCQLLIPLVVSGSVKNTTAGLSSGACTA